MPSNTVTEEMPCTWAIWHYGAVFASSLRAFVILCPVPASHSPPWL